MSTKVLDTPRVDEFTITDLQELEEAGCEWAHEVIDPLSAHACLLSNEPFTWGCAGGAVALMVVSHAPSVPVNICQNVLNTFDALMRNAGDQPCPSCKVPISVCWSVRAI